jgi:hypothetical protein
MNMNELKDIPVGDPIKTPIGWGLAAKRYGDKDGTIGWAVRFVDGSERWYPDHELENPTLSKEVEKAIAWTEEQYITRESLTGGMAGIFNLLREYAGCPQTVAVGLIPADLSMRCHEIRQWKKSGICEQNGALRALADTLTHFDEDDRMRMAEIQTYDELLGFVTSGLNEAPEPIPEGWEVLPEDLRTHLGDFKEAVDLAISLGDPDEYWVHQLKTIDQIEQALAEKGRSTFL